MQSLISCLTVSAFANILNVCVGLEWCMVCFCSSDDFGCFAERGDVWESYPTAPHVGACAEDPSLRAPAQRLSAPPARGRRRLQRRSE